jgi:hypothetical protein
MRAESDRLNRRSKVMQRKIKTHPKEKNSAIRAAKSKARPASDLARQPSSLNAPSTLSPSDILALQQAAGNRAVESMLRGLLGENDHRPSVHKKENSTGLPDALKTGIENLSGISMDDVRVHYNSTRPAEVRALALTQGTDIYLRPSEEKHLPHEAWHVVQQKLGMVKPTQQSNGVPINDDQRLEREADVMGEKATRIGVVEPQGRGEGSIKHGADLTAIAPAAGPNLQAHGGVNVAQLRRAGQTPDANTDIRYGRYMTDHGHSDAEIRAAIIAGWAGRSRRGGGYSVRWGRPHGVLFYDNGTHLMVTHAQSAANIREQQRLRDEANAARSEAGGGAASANWRLP